MSRPDTMRVIDFGRVSGLRSQTLWHAIAHGVSQGEPPTLSLMQPGERYVSIGYHRALQELDGRVCGPGGLPVFRRMVGGGPVYIDEGQRFFQIVVPLVMTPARRADAVRFFLEPAVSAFNDLGIAARLDDHNEVVVGDRKICGHAAGQIEEAVVVVGNLITSFDHTAAASIVAAPSPVVREMFRGEMQRFVTPTPADPQQFYEAAVRRYAEALGLVPKPGALGTAEEARLDELDARFVDSEWLDGSPRHSNGVWRVKVKSGVWVGSASTDGRRLTVGFDGDLVRRVLIEDAAVTNHRYDLAGLRVPMAVERLAADGGSGLALMMQDLASSPPP